VCVCACVLVSLYICLSVRLPVFFVDVVKVVFVRNVSPAGGDTSLSKLLSFRVGGVIHGVAECKDRFEIVSRRNKSREISRETAFEIDYAVCRHVTNIRTAGQGAPASYTEHTSHDMTT